MRIIAGAAGGRRLRTPPGGETRPMMDRVREALFSSLGSVSRMVVADLFAGSGSLGLEALSRGAARVFFVERDRRALAALRSNVEAVALGGEVVAADVCRWLEGRSERFDLVFVDPPYALPLASVEQVLREVGPLLKERGVVVVHRRRDSGVPAAAGLVEVDRRRYGDAEITRFVKEERV